MKLTYLGDGKYHLEMRVLRSIQKSEGGRGPDINVLMMEGTPQELGDGLMKWIYRWERENILGPLFSCAIEFARYLPEIIYNWRGEEYYEEA